MRVGSLFTGYGGLDLGITSLAPHHISTVWTSDIEPGPRAVLAHRFPDAPNLGDVTTIDWQHVEPVDVITGGTPCQDISVAGRRAGMRPGTRSGLWGAMLNAIEALKPALVCWENVPGARSARAATRSDNDETIKDPRTGRVGPRGGRVARPRPPLRALGRVLGDLSSIGYDTQWITLAASDVSAPHLRRRVFVLAHRRGSADAQRIMRDWARSTWQRGPQPPDSSSRPVGGLPPTPTVNDMGAGKDVAQRDAWTAEMRERHGNGNGHGRSLSIELGPYTDACARWAATTGQEPPPPTDSAGRLNAPFVEWMMGLPPGWVTSIDGISRTRQLRLLGNGVVPQQAAAAYRTLAGWGLT